MDKSENEIAPFDLDEEKSNIKQAIVIILSFYITVSITVVS